MDARAENRKKLVDYLVANVPKLTKFTLNKMAYAVEVGYFLRHQRRLTDIPYVFDHYGPYSPMVHETAEESNTIEVKEGVTVGGMEFTGYDHVDERKKIKLPEDVREVADEVISEFGCMSPKQRAEALRDFVYSTSPLTKTEKYQEIDFNHLKPKYKVDPGIREARKKLAEKIMTAQ